MRDLLVERPPGPRNFPTYGRMASSSEADRLVVCLSAWRSTADLVRRDALASAWSREYSAMESLTVTVGIKGMVLPFTANAIPTEKELIGKAGRQDGVME